MATELECPVDFISVNENKVRLTALSVFLFTIFTLGTICLLPFYLYEIINAATPISWNGNMILAIFYLGIGNSIIGFFWLERCY